jgi:hypothetical protein
MLGPSTYGDKYQMFGAKLQDFLLCASTFPGNRPEDLAAGAMNSLRPRSTTDDQIGHAVLNGHAPVQHARIELCCRWPEQPMQAKRRSLNNKNRCLERRAVNDPASLFLRMRFRQFAIPDRNFTTTFGIDPDTGVPVVTDVNVFATTAGWPPPAKSGAPTVPA